MVLPEREHFGEQIVPGGQPCEEFPREHVGLDAGSLYAFHAASSVTGVTHCMRRHDAIVVGADPGGIAALVLARAGRRPPSSTSESSHARSPAATSSARAVSNCSMTSVSLWGSTTRSCAARK